MPVCIYHRISSHILYKNDGVMNMRILRMGSRGPAVELLQLALNRAGFGTLEKDGLFGISTRSALIAFQRANAIAVDGIAGSETHRALLPWYTGYMTHTIRPGDSVWRLARMNRVSEDALLLANPHLDPMNLRIGSSIIIPLDFPVVPTDINYFSSLIDYCVRGLSARYPFLSVAQAGRSVMNRPLWTITLGSGENRVMYNASHHANEWITTPLLLKYIEELCIAFTSGRKIVDYSAGELLDYATLCAVPAVNPDAIDLVTGELQSGAYYTHALEIASAYPQFSFPSGWKANISGVDLNLQYPAGWEQAKKNKEAQGITSPAPADFVGIRPLSAPESRAMYEYTLRFDPALTLSYHTQGEVIYWKYQNRVPFGAWKIVEAFSAVSGYTPENTPFISGFAGYKDWFIDSFERPGFTIEAGLGENPLPIGNFDDIYKKNLGILTLGMIVT